MCGISFIIELIVTDELYPVESLVGRIIHYLECCRQNTPVQSIFQRSRIIEKGRECLVLQQRGSRICKLFGKELREERSGGLLNKKYRSNERLPFRSFNEGPDLSDQIAGLPYHRTAARQVPRRTNPPRSVVGDRRTVFSLGLNGDYQLEFGAGLPNNHTFAVNQPGYFTVCAQADIRLLETL